ncbi:aminoglycoside phosphotransferase family protein [Actinopolymorpha sp. B9G3]|uniref:aminoglycoside phosphotransferase family protein n=1 Tax=Actinopolymorpha sp. B9G3 TaxID=3158970 RepID=UPI0032D8D3F0
MPSPALSAVQTLLSEAFHTTVTIARSEQLAPWSVARCHLAEPPSQLSTSALLPGSVIVKWLREDPSEFRTDPAQVCTERAALGFLAELGVDLVPRLVASDLTTGVLVLEDLFPRVPLADQIRRYGAAGAKTGLVSFARTMGQLHAATAGHAEIYYARRRTYGPVDPQVERLRFMGQRWTQTRRRIEGLGVTMPHRAEQELASVHAVLAEPGPFLAFSNGDAGSNNFLVDGDDGRLTDFEFAGFRHALTDAASLAVPGPMWITVGDPAATGLEDEYRAALASGVPEAADDSAFGFGMAASCHLMALERLGGFDRIDARPPGDSSRVQRVFTLELAASTAERHRCLPHLTGWVREVARHLRKRWPDADVDLANYPAYAPRT